MAIARKPKKTAEKQQVDVDALINKGGSVAKDFQSQLKKDTSDGKPVALRIPASLLEDIDNALQKRSIRMPRHTWILEALAEKLDREK